MSELFWTEANTVVPVAQRGENEGGRWRISLGYSLISHNCAAVQVWDSGSRCRRPSRGSSLYFLTRPVLSLKLAQKCTVLS